MRKLLFLRNLKPAFGSARMRRQAGNINRRLGGIGDLKAIWWQRRRFSLSLARMTNNIVSDAAMNMRRDLMKYMRANW